MITRPVTMLLIFCVMSVLIGVIAAVVCQTDEKCHKYFDVPQMALCCVGCAVVCLALLYVEFGMGHRTGIAN